MYTPTQYVCAGYGQPGPRGARGGLGSSKLTSGHRRRKLGGGRKVCLEQWAGWVKKWYLLSESMQLREASSVPDEGTRADASQNPSAKGTGLGTLQKREGIVGKQHPGRPRGRAELYSRGHTQDPPFRPVFC